MPDIVIHVVASALYAALALHFWNTRWRKSERAEDGLREGLRSGLRAWERAAILMPLALHGGLLYAEVFARSDLRFGFAYALSAMLWLAVLFYWLESFLYDLDAMQPPALALAALTVPLPALFPGSVVLGAYAASIEFRLHLVLAMLAYSLFTIAILHAVLMAVAERRLHRKGGGAGTLFAALPPLLTLERLLFRLIGAAFLLLTLTLATGIAFSETLFGRALRFDHKTVFAVLSWMTFGVLLAGRWLYGWRGRTALRWTLTGFVLLILAYVGSRFVLEVILGRA